MYEKFYNKNTDIVINKELLNIKNIYDHFNLDNLDMKDNFCINL